MGDEAEGIFERVYPEGFARFGICRPPVNLTNVPPKIRYTPDYLTAKGLVEVQGFGNDQMLKLKLDKLQALDDWHDDFRVDLFVWDSKHKRCGFVRLSDLHEACEQHGVMREFPEGKAYVALRAECIPVDDWQTVSNN